MQINRFKLFGAWKNRLTYTQSIELAREISEYVSYMHLPFELSFSPPMIALKGVADLLAGKISLTAQNLVWDDSVSFTGETTAEALRQIGCRYVVIGHSERRIYLGENDSMIARKVSTAVKHNLIPVICIGEFYEDHKQSKSEQVVKEQMNAVLPSLRAVDQPNKFLIAYEPAWAISTSREALKCEPIAANQMHKQIREIIRQEWGNKFADGCSIIYGGNVSPQNAPDYFGQSDIDGGLVGTAAQSKESFIKLIDATRGVFDKKR